MRFWFMQKPVAALAVAGVLSLPVFTIADTAKPASRPYLGIGAMAAKEAGSAGVAVGEVAPESPAGKAGLKKGDRILRAGDKDIKKFEDLRAALAGHKPGDKLALKVERAGKPQTITVTVGEMPPSHRAGPPASTPKTGAFLGVFVQSVTPAVREHLELNVDHGALITEILPGSSAARAGLEQEDVITHVGKVAVANGQEMRAALQKVGAGKEVELTVARGKEVMKVKVQLQELSAQAAVPPGWGSEWPQGMENFAEHFRPFFGELEGNRALEKKVEKLEKRLQELEHRTTK
jgi:S1-C subfamily serine protease